MLGEIKLFAGDFAPPEWAFCEGQLLLISSGYDALFSLLGTTYGGDGRTTFALPDFRGRVPRGTGSGNGLLSVNLGKREGAESISSYPVEVSTPVAEEKMRVNVSNNSMTSILNPSIGMNYIRAIEGYYPSRP